MRRGYYHLGHSQRQAAIISPYKRRNMTGKQCAGVCTKFTGDDGVERKSVIVCTHGPNGRPAVANCAIVKIELSLSKGTAIETTSSLTHCKRCAVATKLRGDTDECIGFLPRRELSEYHAAINSQHPTQFIIDGITKVPITDSLREVVHLYTAKHL